MAGEEDKAAPSTTDAADQFDSDAVFAEAVTNIAGKSGGEAAAPPDDGQDDEGKADAAPKDEPADDGSEDASDDDDRDRDEKKDDAADASAGDEEDPWKDAPTHLKELYEKELQRSRSLKGQVRALTRSRLSRQKPGGGQDDDAARDAERKKLDEAAEQYGDVVGPLVERIRDFDDRFRALDKADQEERETILRFESEAFLQDHPDGFAAVSKNADAFKAWVEDQPKAVREGFELNKNQLVDADSASLVVREFKKHLAAADTGEPSDPPAETKTTTSAKREAQRRGAQGTRTASPPHATEPSRNADDPNAVFDWAVKDLARKGIARA